MLGREQLLHDADELLLNVAVRSGGVGLCIKSDHAANWEAGDALIKSRGVVDSAVCGRASRGSWLFAGYDEEVNRPALIRHTELSFGKEMGGAFRGALTASVGMEETDVGDDGRDGSSDSEAACRLRSREGLLGDSGRR